MTRISKFSGTNFMTRQTPYGFGIRFSVNADKSVFARVTFDESKQGGFGILHGGAISAVLDEAMGTAAYESDAAGYTVHMAYQFASHIPLYQEILIQASVTKIDGKKVYVECSATLADGTVAVSGEGLFIASATLQAMLNDNPYEPENE